MRTIGTFPRQGHRPAFHPDGQRLVTASGVAGLGGVAAIWNVADGALVARFEGHRDILYDAELSPDGKRLATCGYDKKIEIWDADSGKPLRTLEGHTGAVYDVAFSPDSRFLVSASADDTCKVWRVDDGQRMDTLPQPLKAEYTCAFSPDGQLDRGRGGRQQHPRLAVRLARQARDQPDGDGPVRPRRRDRAAGVHAATARSSSRWPRTDDQGLAHQRLQRAQALGQPARRGDGPGVRRRRRVVRGRADGRFAGVVSRSRPSPTVMADAAVSLAKPAERPRAGAINEAAEHEPNNSPAQANRLDAPRPRHRHDRRPAAPGGPMPTSSASRPRPAKQWVFEVNAARSQSKLDSYLEVLDGQGRRVPRVLLQAVRDSYFTFRGKNDSETGDFRVFNWEEMRINDYLYANGEVVKFWLYPRGPDSGFVAYPGPGKSLGLFRHDAAGPCAWRAVLHRRASSAGNEAGRQRPAGLLALL